MICQCASGLHFNLEMSALLTPMAGKKYCWYVRVGQLSICSQGRFCPLAPLPCHFIWPPFGSFCATAVGGLRLIIVEW